jgi:hypothetical protein
VVSPLPDACAAITTWLPQAAALTHQPDTDGSSGHGKPGSRPPWNAAAANAYLDAHEFVRRLEPTIRYAVTGRPGKRRGGSDANTYQAIGMIENLSEALTEHAQAQIARLLWRLVTPIRQHPAVDLDERPQKVSGAACPYCGCPMLRLFPRSGRVTCLRFGACWDGNGDHPQGQVDHSVGGEPMVAWADGLCQYAAMEAT